MPRSLHRTVTAWLDGEQVEVDLAIGPAEPPGTPFAGHREIDVIAMRDEQGQDQDEQQLGPITIGGVEFADEQALELRHLGVAQRGVGGRGHGGDAQCGQTLAGENRLPDLRRLRLVRNQSIGQLQSALQHRIHRHHRCVDSQHLDEAR